MKTNHPIRHCFGMPALLILMALTSMNCWNPRSARVEVMAFDAAVLDAADFDIRLQAAEAAIRVLVDNRSIPDTIPALLKRTLAGRLRNDLSIPEVPPNLLETKAWDAPSRARAEAVLLSLVNKIAICRLDVFQNLRQRIFESVQSIAAKLDSSYEIRYWVELFRFLTTADTTAVQRWQLARHAFVLSGRYQTGDAQYGLSQHIALYGMSLLEGVPDRRAYLDLCMRLQSTIWFHDEAYRLAIAIGDWVIDACEKEKYYFRVAAQEYNVANQLIIDRQHRQAINRLERVFALIERWDVLREPNWQWYYRNSLRAMAEAQKNAGDPHRALPYLEELQKHLSDNRLRALYHKLLAELAKDQARFERAEQEFRIALSLTIEEQPRGKRIVDFHNSWAITVGLADLYLKLNLPEQADRLLAEWEALARQQNPTYLQRARVAALHALYRAKPKLAMSDFQAADHYLQQAKEWRRRLASEKLAYQILSMSAALFEERGDYEKAFQQLQLAQRLCRENRFFLEEMATAVQLIGLSLRAPHLPGVQTYRETLSEIIENVRRIGYKPILVETLAQAVRSAMARGRLAEARQFAATLFTEIQNLRLTFHDENHRLYFDHSVAEALKTTIIAEIAAGQTQSALARMSYAKGYSLRSQMASSGRPIPASVGELQAHLQQGEALIEYLLSDSAVYRFFISPNAFRLDTLAVSRLRLQRQVQRYVALLHESRKLLASTRPAKKRELYAQMMEQSTALYRALLPAFESAPFADPKLLYIVPDDFLHSLPFATLAEGDFDDHRFLVEKRAVQYLPGSWILCCRANPVVFADTRGILCSIDSRFSGTRNLMNHLRALLPPGAELRTAWRDIPEFQIALGAMREVVLLFSHARADWDTPSGSFIEIPLSGGKTEKLFFSDVIRSGSAGHKLVILAGCETAGNRVYLGTGLSGLQYAFLAGSTQQVLSTFWQVESEHTIDLVSALLVSMQTQPDPARALQQAQVSAIQRLRRLPLFRYPFPQLWGGFMLIGMPTAGAEIAARGEGYALVTPFTNYP